MKITITGTDEPQANAVRVSFSSASGQGTAHWHGARPVLGATYFVELESDDTMALTQNALELNSPLEEVMISESGSTNLSGQLTAITEEGTGIFRVGDGQIELEIADAAAWRIGQHYRLQLTSLTVFDQAY